MGSGAETVYEVVDLLSELSAKVGLVRARLYRPCDAKALIAALPASVQSIAVLDRTKEPGSAGEPLYQDVVTAFNEAFTDGAITRIPRIVGGRYGLGSKEFTPGMAKSVFDNLVAPHPKNHFTVGIVDDVADTSLPWDDTFNNAPAGVHTAMFYGLGADGTVGANKNSIKI